MTNVPLLNVLQKIMVLFLLFSVSIYLELTRIFLYDFFLYVVYLNLSNIVCVRDFAPVFTFTANDRWILSYWKEMCLLCKYQVSRSGYSENNVMNVCKASYIHISSNKMLLYGLLDIYNYVYHSSVKKLVCFFPIW